MHSQNRIGLMGGSFDPVHNGHLAIAESFLSSEQINELWILLTPNPPHKSKQQFTAFYVRLNMLQACFADFENVEISSIENQLPPPQYTYKTIQHLESLYPEYSFFYCLGEDGYVNFHKWKRYEKILDSCSLIVAARPGYDKSKQRREKIKQAATFVNHTPVDISSTEIRKLVKRGGDISSYLPNVVAKIIEDESLYIEN